MIEVLRITILGLAAFGLTCLCVAILANAITEIKDIFK